MFLFQCSCSCNAVTPDATFQNSPQTMEEQKLCLLEAKVTGLEASVAMLIEGVENMTNMVTTWQSAKVISQDKNLTASPPALTHGYTPRQSIISKPTDEINSKLKRNIYGSSAEKVDVVDVFQIRKESLKKSPFPSLSMSGQKGLRLGEMEPFSNADVNGMKSSVGLPKWIRVCFTPPDDMVLDELNAFVVAYLFGLNKCAQEDEEELIVYFSNKQFGRRKDLKTLLPGKCVDQQVMNLLVSLLTAKERSVIQQAADVSFWFLPTTLSHYAIDGNRIPSEVIRFYQKDFMGKLDHLKKIFLPVNYLNCHWYLVIVDVVKGHLIILDSLPGFVNHDSRRIIVRKMALFLEEMLTDSSYHIVEAPEQITRCRPPPISEYPIVNVEELGSQRPNSNDCGIWVAKWMMECRWSDNYKIQVDEKTRMKLALNLALSSNNTCKDELIKDSAKNWNDLEKKHRSVVVIE
ncbi:unnamed protein product [Cuscuta epithymum]|uniref:Ubiquitin-like protease family profile domain-containing protein n=1 Tax=Cuscuta epithymum TaxID=186058 RepID=A0AAV0FNA7_9ASTE|nr:unnamed protein product [Cuscuta epithymum]